MQASGNRIARGVVRALESQVVNTARYMTRPERAMCVASHRGHRRVYERSAAHDPSGAAEAMFTHITEAGSSDAVHQAARCPWTVGKRHRRWHRVTGWPSGW
jgi:DNA-binding FadR family transcriptional regulator